MTNDRKDRPMFCKIALAAVLVLTMAAPASADLIDPGKRPSEPCSTHNCSLRTLTLDPGGTVTFTTSQRFAVWTRTQQFGAFVNGGKHDVLWGVEAAKCGAYFYGRGITLLATMPNCTQKKRSAVRVRITSGRIDRVRLRVAVRDMPASTSEGR